MPDWKEEIRQRVASLRLAPTREAEIVEELAQHLEDRYEQLLLGGATNDEAYQQSLNELAESDLLARELRRVARAAAAPRRRACARRRAAIPALGAQR